MRQRLKKNKKKFFILLAGLVILSVFCYIQNNLIVISNYNLQSDKVEKSGSGVRIVQVSDLHNKQFGKDNKRLISKIAELNPDIIVITGDLVDSNRSDTGIAVNFVKQLMNIAPVYYVNGNHENWLDDTKKEKFYNDLEACGAILLENKKVMTIVEESYVNLIGVYDEFLSSDILSEIEIEDDRLNVLLAHEPQFINKYANKNIDVVFSGHAHGGQFILPFIGGVVAPDQGLNPEYTQGLYEEDGTKMVVSRGLGNSIIPLRIFNYPEIVCVDFDYRP